MHSLLLTQLFVLCVQDLPTYEFSSEGQLEMTGAIVRRFESVQAGTLPGISFYAEINVDDRIWRICSESPNKNDRYSALDAIRIVNSHGRKIRVTGKARITSTQGLNFAIDQFEIFD